jgi:hypothetical protein
MSHWGPALALMGSLSLAVGCGSSASAPRSATDIQEECCGRPTSPTHAGAHHHALCECRRRWAPDGRLAQTPANTGRKARRLDEAPRSLG